MLNIISIHSLAKFAALTDNLELFIKTKALLIAATTPTIIIAKAVATMITSTRVNHLLLTCEDIYYYIMNK
jgi:hypothetical protein